MSAYDDMPLGTVLRNRLTDTVFIKTHHGSLGWLAVRKGRTAKRVTNLAMTAVLDLVHLVEWPIASRPPRLVDRDGNPWVECASGWHMAICPDNCPVQGRPRADVEADFGPLTEEQP